MSNKNDIIKMMEDINDKDEFEEIKYEFNIDEIKDAINKVIDELNPTFLTVFDISIFLGKVAKKLVETVYDTDLSIENKYTVIITIASSVLEELELRGLITLDLSIQFKEIFKDSSQFKDTISNISNFMKASPEQKQLILVNSFQNLLTNFF
jgi:hypothetical protein